jgi:four helix bundle protein
MVRISLVVMVAFSAHDRESCAMGVNPSFLRRFEQPAQRGCENERMTTYDLPAWDRSHRLTTNLYRLTRRLADPDRALGDTLCQVAARVPICIAEAQRRVPLDERRALWEQAAIHAAEVETLLLVLADLEALNRSGLGLLLKENKVIARLISSQRQALSSPGDVISAMSFDQNKQP